MKKRISAAPSFIEAKLSTGTLTFRNGGHVSLDGWTSNVTSGCFLPVAWSSMVTTSVFVGSSVVPVECWNVESHLIGFGFFDEKVHDPSAYFKGLVDALAVYNKKPCDVISGSTDTTGVCPSIFDNDALKHAFWISCKQHVGDLAAEDTYDLPEFKAMYNPLHTMVTFFSNDQRMAPLKQKQIAVGRRPLIFIRNVLTRFLTRFIEAARVIRLWPVLQQLTDVDMSVSAKPAAVSNAFLNARAALAPQIADITDLLQAVSPLLHFSPQFGSEQHFTISITGPVLRLYLDSINGVLNRQPPPSDNVVAVLRTLRRSLTERIGSNADHLPDGGVRKRQRERSILFEQAGEALDGSTAYSWIVNGGDPIKLESTLYELLEMRLVLEQQQQQAAPPPQAGGAPLVRPPGMSDAMWAIVSAQAAPPAMALLRSVYDVLRDALHDEVTNYCNQAFTDGQEWAAECGAIFESKPARGTHWPKLRKRYPLLAVCAWFVLSAMNSNVITERANSIGRLVLTHLRGHARPADTVRLVLSYYANRAARKARQNANYVHRDIVLLGAAGGAGGPGPAPGGALAAAAALGGAEADDADDAQALPADDLEEEEMDALLRGDGAPL
jgi:hypothetical protein